MPNDFYNHGSFPTTGSAATSASMRAELDLIASAFDKMPDLTGTQNQIITVNASGTGLSASNDIVITPAGFVGIGTSAPLAPLNVNANGGEIIRLSLNPDGTAQQEPAIGFASREDDTNPAVKISALEYALSDRRASLLFYTRGFDTDSAPTERMRITHDGLVGIGTGTPAQELHIYKDSNTSTSVYVENPNTGSSAAANLTLANNSGTAVFVSGSSTYGGSEITGGALGAGLYTSAALTNGLSVGTSAGPLKFFAGSTSAERARLDGGNFIVGHTSQITGSGGIAPRVEAVGTSGSTGSFAGYTFSTSGSGPNLELGLSKNASIGTFTTPVSGGDIVGVIRFSGSDGSSFGRVAQIVAAADATASSGNTPGRLVFSTTPSIGTAPSERMRIDSSGYVGIGETSPTELLYVKAEAGATGRAVVGGGSTAVLVINGDQDNSGDTGTEDASLIFNVDGVYNNATNSGLGNNGFRLGLLNGSGVQDLSFVSITNSVDLEVMRLSSSGSVGIGTTTPQYSLEIQNGNVNGDVITLLKANPTAGQTDADATLILDGGSVVATTVTAGSFVVGTRYRISALNTTDFTLIGASANTVGVSFIATGAGTGTGTAVTLNSGESEIYFRNSGYDRAYISWTEDLGYLVIDANNGGNDGNIRLTADGGNGVVQVYGSNNGLTGISSKNTLRFFDSDISTATNQPIGVIDFYSGDTTAGATGVGAYILAAAAGANGGADLRFGTAAVGANGSPTEKLRIDSVGNVGIATQSPQTALHIASGATTGATLRLENTLTSINTGNLYGTIDFFGNDNSASANGVRAKIDVNATSATGAATMRFYTTTSSSTTLTLGLTVATTGISTTGISASGNASITGTLSVGGTITQTTNVVSTVGGVTMTSADTQTDVDLTASFPASSNYGHYMMVDAQGLYMPSGGTYATSSRLFKSWAQNIAWNGTTYVIAGAVLKYAAYNQDAANFPAGAVNASKVLTVVSTTQVLLRFQNRTTPAAGSATYFTYKMELHTV